MQHDPSTRKHRYPRRPSPCPIATGRFASLARDAAGPSRPAARPSTQASRHHLEPNPFEQSFSSKPSNNGRSVSPDGAKAKKLAHKSTKSDSGIDDGLTDGNSAATAADGNRKSLGGAPTTPSGQSAAAKRLLPPASSLASPAGQDQTMQYPWAPSLTGSLRAGPLSPAMLAGPQSFDPSSFRTGFTPDLTNFKTGLTPLGTAGGSFPPPSPNTAAFLAMVTNGSGGGLSAAGITPNTLSALNGNPMDAHANNPGAIQTAQAANGQHDAALLKYAQNNAQQQKSQRSPKSKKGQGKGAGGREDGSDGNFSRDINGQGNQTSQAASGLFLLSQAHQELAKREDAASHQPDGGFGGGMQDGQHLYNDAPPNENNKPAKAGKRKSNADGKGGSSNKKTKAAAKAEAYSPSAESDELLEEMPQRHGSSSNGGGSVADDMGGDDDEKRKNFLERNRQAALKCRQRKKAWLASLQTKVEYLQSDNENLQGTVGALRNEVMFLKSQLMQAQRQLATHGVPPPGPDNMTRHSVSGPMGMPAGMMPTAMTQVPHSNIHAMAAAAAAATSGANMMANGSYPNHNAGPRPTHMPTHAGPPFGVPTSKAPRQNSVQAM